MSMVQQVQQQALLAPMSVDQEAAKHKAEAAGTATSTDKVAKLEDIAEPDI